MAFVLEFQLALVRRNISFFSNLYLINPLVPGVH